MNADPLVEILRRLDAIEARLAPPDAWFDAKQAAAYFGISPRRIYSGARTGTLKHVVVDRRGGAAHGTEIGTIRVKRAWLDEWFQSRANAAWPGRSFVARSLARRGGGSSST